MEQTQRRWSTLWDCTFYPHLKNCLGEWTIQAKSVAWFENFRDALMYALGIGEWIVADKGTEMTTSLLLLKIMDLNGCAIWLQNSLLAMRQSTAADWKTSVSCAHQPFRQGMVRHQSVFNALANVIQIQLMVEAPLFSVDYDDRAYSDYLNQ